VFPRYGLGLESVALTCGEFWGGTGQTEGFETMAFSDATSAHRVIVSVDVNRGDPHDPHVVPLLLAMLNTINLYLCHEPYRLPTNGGDEDRSAAFVDRR
jgi:D-alanyl-D-alanine carboxypeptidase